MSCNLRNHIDDPVKFIQCFDSQNRAKNFKELRELSIYESERSLVNFLKQLQRDDILSLFEEARITEELKLDRLRGLSDEKLGIEVRKILAGDFREEMFLRSLEKTEPLLWQRIERILAIKQVERRGTSLILSKRPELFQHVVPEFLDEYAFERLQYHIPEYELEKFRERVKLGQGQATPESGKYVFPRSKRAKTNMRRLGVIPSKAGRENITILGEEVQEHHQLCIKETPGLYEGDLFIRVSRYGDISGAGTYSRQVSDSFTWYYFEPDSEIYLRAGRIFVDNNKASFCYRFKDLLSGVKKFEQELKYFSEDVFGGNNSEWDEFLSPNGRHYEIPSNLDQFDRWIYYICLDQGFDCVIFSNERSGRSDRYVSELLDVRIRQESYDNLYYLE